MSSVAVLLPAHNEEAAIGLVIDDIRSVLLTTNGLFSSEISIVVVDNCCTDKTAQIAKDEGAQVLTCPTRGKGNAVRMALQEVEADYYVMLDSDYTYPAAHIPEMLRLLKYRADVVIGYRQWQDHGATAGVNKIGNWVLTKMARVLLGYPVQDVCSGMWGFRRDAVSRFALKSTDFALEVELLAEALRTECRIAQMSISYRARLDGSRTKLRVADGIKIAKVLVNLGNARRRGT